MTSTRYRRLRDWQMVPVNPGIPDAPFELILRRRRQMLVHSCIYYALDDNIVSDAQWSAWAKELVQLQHQYGSECSFYDWAFRDWDGTSGYHLPTNDPDVRWYAERLLAYRDKA